jgi:hypothetical protein
LNKFADIPGARVSVSFGLALLIPVLIWVYATAGPALGSVPDGVAFTLKTVRMLSLVLALGVPVSLPWFANSPDWNDTIFGPLMVTLIPLPLLTVLWLTGDLRFLVLLLPSVGIALIMMTLSVIQRLVAAGIRNLSAVTLVQNSISILAAGVAWALRDEWLAWFGL